MKLITAFLFLVYSASSVLAVDTPAVPLLPGLYALSYTAKLEKPFDNINLTAAVKYNVRIDPDLQARMYLVSFTTTPPIGSLEAVLQLAPYNITGGMLRLEDQLSVFVVSGSRFFQKPYSPILTFQTIGSNFPLCFWDDLNKPQILVGTEQVLDNRIQSHSWFMKRPIYKSTNVSLSVSEQLKAIDPSFAVTPAYVFTGSNSGDVTKFPAGVVTLTQTLVVTRIKN